MDIDAAIFLRQDIARLGIAPLTSMYWFSEKSKPRAVDWRPELHDSDGLAIWTGKGERIWRPLNNPQRPGGICVSATTIRAASACRSATGYSTTISTACDYE